ncbi:hypothetical protein BDZ91DRAFT_849190 [Kalaharituber pfeilii]|nr:hypothetical protein BDZ91DRAFT_849190 [Kalaharituber pfeilii]
MNSPFWNTMDETTSRAFQKALDNFTAKLSKEQIEEFQNSGSIRDVYICIEALEEKHRQSRTLRYLARVNPYLEGLQQYAKVIDVIVQIKPEIMAIVWVCMRFILQAASDHLAFFEKLVETFERIGENLPRQQRLENIFCNNPRVQHVTILIYEEILAFQWETLQFLHKKALKQFIHTILHPFEAKFGKIVGRLERHRMLLDYEAIGAHIEAVNEDRQRHLAREEEERREHENSQRQQLQAWLKPVDYESEMAFVHKELDKLPGDEYEAMQNFWLMRLPAVEGWMGLETDGKPVMWLTGMPGAVLRTFIFQLLQHTSCLLPYLFQEYTSKRFQGFRSPTNRKDLCRILEACLDYIPGSTYVILDGLDETEREDRQAVLETIQALHATSKELRIFISSRRETDIEAQLLDLNGQLEHISIANQNADDIAAYVEARGRDLHQAFSHDKAAREEVADALTKICNKAQGMFLWARLVLQDLAQCTNLEDLQEAVDNLPKGLEEAYQRILDRIEKLRNSPLGREAIRILQMVICSKRPLRKQEIQHALAIRTGDIRIEQRRLLRRKLEELCGPILTVEDETGEQP